jgi:hypothetical protein
MMSSSRTDCVIEDLKSDAKTTIINDRRYVRPWWLRGCHLRSDRMLFPMDRDMHATRYIRWTGYLLGPATTLGRIAVRVGRAGDCPLLLFPLVGRIAVHHQ